MFKYVKYNKVKDEFTTHELRGGSEDVKVHIFDSGVASIKSDDVTKIDELIANQSELINCTEITKDEFKELVKDSRQLYVIKQSITNKIAEKYSYADELAMLKRSDDDVKKVAYNAFVAECVSYGDRLKLDIGIESSFEELKIKKIALLERKKDAEQEQPVEVRGLFFWGGRVNGQKYKEAFDLTKLMGRETGMVSHTGGMVEVDEAYITEVLVAVGSATYIAWAKYKQLEAMVVSATTQKELDAIVW